MKQEIMRKAIRGTGCTPEWVAEQTVRLYRKHVAAGMPHDDALAAAKQDMAGITKEALRSRRRNLRYHLEAWLIIAIGVLACIGWWLLWV